MVLFQILFLAFSLLGIFTILLKKRKNNLSTRGALFWLLCIVAADIAVIQPEITTTIANRFGIGRGVDFVVYLSIILIFFILFRLHLKVESISRDITELIRQRALDEIEEE